MIRAAYIVASCLLLAACSRIGTREAPVEGPVPPARAETAESWTVFKQRIDAMDANQLRAERTVLSDRLDLDPDDAARLQLAYTLSRPEPTASQLHRAARLLADIPPGSEWSGTAELLAGEVALRLRLQQAEGRILELQAQIEALKAIEAEMSEHRDDLESGTP